MTRVISGALLAAAALAAIWFLPTFLLTFVAVAVAYVAVDEYNNLVLRIAGSKPLAAFSAVLVVMYGALAHFRSGDIALLVLLALAGPAGAIFGGPSLAAAALGMFAMVYIGAPLAILLWLHQLRGPSVVLLLIGTVAASDTGQYYAGRMFGRRKLAPSVSPKKTIEGAIGGAITGMLVMAVVGRWILPELAVWQLLLTGALLVGAGIEGDLFESALKRAAGVKDSSSLIPGHGGVLDRIDALLFAAPTFFYLLDVMAAITP